MYVYAFVLTKHHYSVTVCTGAWPRDVALDSSTVSLLSGIEALHRDSILLGGNHLIMNVIKNQVLLLIANHTRTSVLRTSAWTSLFGL